MRLHETIMSTNLRFDNLKRYQRGKVRDVYHLENDLLVMVATDRVSAFDIVMNKGIPFKGQVLNQLSAFMLQKTKKVVPNWFIESPDPNVSVGLYCKPFPIEMVIRGYLVGHVFRLYDSGKREICDISLREGMKQFDPFDSPIITPTTKVKEGHDLDISKSDILESGLVDPSDYQVIERYTQKLFELGSEIATKRGLVLVDAKYEFGKTSDGRILLIDEVHTADSARYVYEDSLKKYWQNRSDIRHLSKEFFRQWLISKGFQGKLGQTLPEVNSEVQEKVSKRYIELFQLLCEQKFNRFSTTQVDIRIQDNIDYFLDSYQL